MPLRFDVFNLFDLFALLWSPDSSVEGLFADNCLLAGKKPHIKIQWWDLELDSGWKWLITEVLFSTMSFCLAQFDCVQPLNHTNKVCQQMCHPCF